ncbi:hypothetical protein [Azospirillum melinis]
MESPNSQMWGARGFPRSPPSDTKGPEQSGPFVFSEVGPPLRHDALRQDALVALPGFILPFTPARGAGQDLAWAHDDGMRAIFARFLKCVRGVARLSTVLEESPVDGISRTPGWILAGESSTCRAAPPAVRVAVSPLCRKIRLQTSPLCRKILGRRRLGRTGWSRRTSPFCRMMERIPPLPSPPRYGIGGESGGNRPYGGSSERRRSASRCPPQGPPRPILGSQSIQ